MRRRGLILLAGPLVGFLVFGGQGTADSAAPDPVAFVLQGSYGRAGAFEIALGDLDGDGDLDAVFASTPTEIWKNDGSGRFTNTYQRLAAGGHGAGLGDFDNDGDLDLFLAVASRDEASKVYLNDGSGRFRDSGQDLGDRRAAANLVSIADIDADGDLDAALYYSDHFNAVYLNDGSGLFERVPFTIPGMATWGDLDGDGDIDAVAQETSGAYVTWIHIEAGAFVESWRWSEGGTGFLPGDAALGDLDNDGDLDFVDCHVVLGVGEPVVILLNDGNGAFTFLDSGEEPLRAVASRVSLRDLNADGHLDLFLGSLEGPDRIGLNDGTGRLVDSGLLLGGDMMDGISGVGDLDGDGDLDLFIARYGSAAPNEVWLNSPE